MDAITSTEFRKQYAGLRKPTAVTVNGHVIGQWIPEHSATYVMARMVDDDGTERYEAHGLTPPPKSVAVTNQAQRDDLLRKINRGSKP